MKQNKHQMSAEQYRLQSLPKNGQEKKSKKQFILQGENLIQANICKMLDLLKIDYYSIPNGTHKKSRLLKWLFGITGLKPGVPDLHLPAPVEYPEHTREYMDNEVKYLSVYLEVKVPGKDAEPEQAIWHQKLRKHGHYVEVVHSVKEAIQILIECYPHKIKNVPNLQKEFR